MKKVIGSTLLAVGAAFAFSGCGGASPGVIVTCDVSLTSAYVADPANELAVFTEHVSYTDPATASTTPLAYSGGELKVISATAQPGGVQSVTVCAGNCADTSASFGTKQTIVTDADGTATFTLKGPSAGLAYVVIGSQAPASCQAALP